MSDKTLDNSRLRQLVSKASFSSAVDRQAALSLIPEDDNEVALYVEGMTRQDKSTLLYAETCLVDHGGLLEGQRMNGADLKALLKFEHDGLARSGRIPAALLGEYKGTRKPTHWIELTPFGWAVAHELRRWRARDEARGPYATAVFNHLGLEGKL